MPAGTEDLAAAAAEQGVVDRDEYPMTAQLEDRCLDIIADFWNAPEPDEPMTATNSPSEIVSETPRSARTSTSPIV